MATASLRILNNTGERRHERHPVLATTNNDDKFGPTNLKLLQPGLHLNIRH